MSFWGTYFPVFAALVSWSLAMEALQMVIHYFYAKRQAQKMQELQDKLAEMGERGELPPLDVLSRILAGGGDGSFPNFQYPQNVPVTVSGSGIPSHGQYL